MSILLDQAEQTRLIEKYMGFAKNVAGQIAPNVPLEVEDAIQVAYIGLIEAAKRFDLSKYDPEIADLDTNFKSYAFLRIRGAVYDESRRMTFVRRRGLEKGLSPYMFSLDEMVEGIDGSLIPAHQLPDIPRDIDLSIDFERAVEGLTEREHKVVFGIGVGGKGKELAEEFGITESRVSQIAAEARDKMKKEMAA